jgi:anaerobic selenocysteine-containing dehydrogenase
MKIPHWAPPTHAMQIFRYAEQGSINFLCVSCTNPDVFLPELHRTRDILVKEDPFVVVQDIFLTETARLADVVLPAATWGEKTGTYTNTDRTGHLSEAAVRPPGEAKHDLDISTSSWSTRGVWISATETADSLSSGERHGLHRGLVERLGGRWGRRSTRSSPACSRSR